MSVHCSALNIVLRVGSQIDISFVSFDCAQFELLLGRTKRNNVEIILVQVWKSSVELSALRRCQSKLYGLIGSHAKIE